MSSQDKIFKKGFCELIKKKAVLILINSWNSVAAHIFKVCLYWSNIHDSDQTFILHKLLYNHFVWSLLILRSVLKFIAVDLRVRIEYKELRAWKCFQNSIHVVRNNLSYACNNPSFFLCRLEFLIIIVLFIFFSLNASFNIIDKMVELSKDYCGEDSDIFKLWNQFFKMLNLLESTRC